ncbi:MAG: alpha-mannosidase [Desertimonas sp.]
MMGADHDRDPLTVHLIPHFHVDPVWWNTQPASIDQLDASDWSASPRLRFQRSALDVLRLHLVRAERDPLYRTCVAEVDYLEPFWYHHPHERARLRRLIECGRVEVVGGTYNEPNSNLTTLELTRRNLEHGLRFQRDVLGATVRTAWQLDVFGHDPMFPSVLADAGLDGVVFARGPFRPWGPMLEGGFDSPSAARPVQFPAEFEWVAPDGRGVLAAYLPTHYSSGYAIDACDTLEDAVAFIGRLAAAVAPMAATSNVLLPIGTDLGPPARWITEVVRWSANETDGPRIVCSTPTEALDAVRSESVATGRRLSTQTRDMNPIYTGKDVSAIDLKQAQRATEDLVAQAERWFVGRSGHDPSTRALLDDVWRLLVYGAHHDALTGTHSDQVYLDLLASAREAWSRARTAVRAVLPAVAPASGSPPGLGVQVFQTAIGERTDATLVELDAGLLEAWPTAGLDVVDAQGRPVPFVADVVERAPDGALRAAVITVLVTMHGPGPSQLWVRPSDVPPPTWTPVTAGDDIDIANERYRLRLDPRRGGAVTSWLDRRDGIELVAAGGAGGEIVRLAEYREVPGIGEGPWHLVPTGQRHASADRPADVSLFTSPIGQRAVARGHLESGEEWSSEYTLWTDVERVEVNVALSGVAGTDQLYRVRWPCPVRGARPVMETGDAVIGRGWAFTDTDAAVHPWTLDTPATGWAAWSSTLVIGVVAPSGPITRAVAVAEVVVDHRVSALAPALVVALARSGVTATASESAAPRYGALSVDSNAPDTRFVVGLADDPVVAAVTARLGRAERERLAALGAVGQTATAFVPAAGPLRAAWQPDLDVRDLDALPVVLVIVADATASDSLGGLVRAIEDEHRIELVSADRLPRWVLDESLDDRTVALFNRGIPGVALDSHGVIHLSLMRSPSGWPVGQWIDPPRRSAPDGSAFGHGHWTHHFEAALAASAGDWRASGLVRTARELDDRRWTIVSGVGASATSTGSIEDPGAPRFSRWWVQGRGPRLSTHGPVAVHLHPPANGPDRRWVVTLARVDTGQAARPVARDIDVELSVTVPAGWDVDQPSRVVRLGPAGWTAVELGVVEAPSAPGHHLVRVVARVHGDAGGSTDVVIVDEHVVSVRSGHPVLAVGPPPAIVAVPGERLTIPIEVSNGATSSRVVDLDVLSPWGTWNVFPRHRLTDDLAPGTTVIEVPVEVPWSARPGTWWWSLRAVAGATIVYSGAATLVVMAR